MGLFDKIKNALFEEEYVEVEEKPKKVKKELPKIKEVERPIAKKVVLPEKKEVKVEELEEDELLDEDFEIQPKSVEKEEIEENDRSRERDRERERRDFKVMDEDDFKVDEEVEHRNYRSNEPKIVKVIEREEKPVVNEEPVYYQKKVEKPAYGMSEASKINVPDYGRSAYDGSSYGAYERKEDRTHFKPSPIISPIYGILDKNYKKEDVVTKKEVRLTSSYARENLSVEDVRKKAYGSLSDDIVKEIEVETPKATTFNVDVAKDEDVNLLVDLSDDEEKPSVKEVTMGDALEYFEDLGLEYNVDYVDANKPAPTGRRTKENYDEDRDVPAIISKVEEPVVEEVKEVKREIVREEDPVIRKAESSIDSDDNLFDLIDSMYKEND